MPTLAIIHDENDRQQVISWIKTCPIGTQVQLKKPTRTLPQNARLWSMLTDIVRQKKTINGQTLDTEGWKTVFMHALGHELRQMPTLDGRGAFLITYSTSALTKEHMSGLIDLIFSWGAENDVIWSDPAMKSYEEMVHR